MPSPIAQSPIAKSPIAKSPIAKSPIAKSPIANNCECAVDTPAESIRNCFLIGRPTVGLSQSGYSLNSDLSAALPARLASVTESKKTSE